MAAVVERGRGWVAPYPYVAKAERGCGGDGRTLSVVFISMLCVQCSKTATRTRRARPQWQQVWVTWSEVWGSDSSSPLKSLPLDDTTCLLCYFSNVGETGSVERGGRGPYLGDAAAFSEPCLFCHIALW